MKQLVRHTIRQYHMLPDGAREALVNATNVYHKTPRGWRLVAHHASVGEAHEGGLPTSSAHMLH